MTVGAYDRFKGAFDSGLSAFDQPGPEIPVRPFAPGEVTAPSGILKAITRLAAVRQARANQRVKDEVAAAEGQKRTLEVQSLTQRIAAGQRTPRTIGGQTINMTDAEFAQQQAGAIPKPPARVPANKALVTKYGKYLGTAQPDPQNPEMFTVDERELGNAEQAANADALAANRSAANARAEEYKRMRAEANGKGQSYAAAMAQKRALDLEVEVEAKAAGQKAWQMELAALEQRYEGEDKIPPIQIEKAKTRMQQAIDDARLLGRAKRKTRYAEYDMVIDTAAFGSGLDAQFSKWAAEDQASEAN